MELNWDLIALVMAVLVLILWWRLLLIQASPPWVCAVWITCMSFIIGVNVIELGWIPT